MRVPGCRRPIAGTDVRKSARLLSAATANAASGPNATAVKTVGRNDTDVSMPRWRSPRSETLCRSAMPATRASPRTIHHVREFEALRTEGQLRRTAAARARAAAQRIDRRSVRNFGEKPAKSSCFLPRKGYMLAEPLVPSSEVIIVSPQVPILRCSARCPCSPRCSATARPGRADQASCSTA